MGDTLHSTPINRRAKFNAASFKPYIHTQNKQTNKQTGNDISTPFLSACVDNQRNNRQQQLLPVTLNISDKFYYIFHQVNAQEHRVPEAQTVNLPVTSPILHLFHLQTQRKIRSKVITESTSDA